MRDWMIIEGFGHIGQSHTPGRCAKCGTSDSKRRVIGSGINISTPYHQNSGTAGEIQVCDECVKAAARLIGMIDPERAADLLESARTANLAKSRDAKRIAKLEAAVAALQNLRDPE